MNKSFDLIFYGGEKKIILEAFCLSGDIKFSAKPIKAISKRGNINDYEALKIRIV